MKRYQEGVMTNYEKWILGFTIITAIIAFVSLYRTRKITRIQIDLEKISAQLSKKQIERMEAQEEAATRAYVDVEFVGDKIYITNTGGAKARNVQFDVKDATKPYPENQHRDMFPISNLSPGKNVTLIAAISAGHPLKYSVTYNKFRTIE